MCLCVFLFSFTMAYSENRAQMNKEGMTIITSTKLKIVALQEFIKVRHWDEEWRPKNPHINTVAGVTDGEKVFKFTLFKDLASQVEEGNTYIFKNFEKAKYGNEGSLLCRKDTRIYCCSPIVVPEDVEAKARGLVCPPSPKVLIKNIKGSGEDLVTVEGSITSVSFWRLA